MAKHHKWEGDILTYEVPNAGVATLDVSKLADDVFAAAAMFGIQTAARNATAGLFTEDPATALKRIQTRFAAWLAGEWKAVSAGAEGAESKTSMLAKAVAKAGGIEVEEAAKIISDLIEAKVTEAGLSADEDDDKPAIRKIAAAVRGAFSETPEVAVVLTSMRAEAAQARAAEAAAASAKAEAEGKVGGLKALLGK